MDFGDILTLLIYIAIPVFISGKRKAKKAQEEARRKRPPMQQPMQSPAQRQPMKRRPVQGSTGDGGIFGRLESMLKELERAAQSANPPADQNLPGSGKTGRLWMPIPMRKEPRLQPSARRISPRAAGQRYSSVAGGEWIVGKETPAKPGPRKTGIQKGIGGGRAGRLCTVWEG